MNYSIFLDYVTTIIQHKVGTIRSSRPLLEFIICIATIANEVMAIFIVINMCTCDIGALPIDGFIGGIVEINIIIVGDRLTPSIIVAIGCLGTAGYRGGSNIHRGPLLATNLDKFMAIDRGLRVSKGDELDGVFAVRRIIVGMDECAILVYFDYLCIGAHCGYDAEEEK